MSELWCTIRIIRHYLAYSHLIEIPPMKANINLWLSIPHIQIVFWLWLWVYNLPHAIHTRNGIERSSLLIYWLYAINSVLFGLFLTQWWRKYNDIFYPQTHYRILIIFASVHSIHHQIDQQMKILSMSWAFVGWRALKISRT